MQGCSIIVIGASLGGTEALARLVEGLPKQLNAAICIVLHVGKYRSHLPALLERHTDLPVTFARDGQAIAAGHIYVAPPDHHLLVQPGRLKLAWGPKENFARPAIDPLFRSAAEHYGAQVVGVILTGGGDDGVAGLLAIKARGGVAIVQDPDEAVCPSMPKNAAACVQVDHLCSIAEIARLIIAYDPPGTGVGNAPPCRVEGETTQADPPQVGSPSSFTCPECGSVLHQLHDGRLLRFRCRLGHALSAHSLRAHLASVEEQALWHTMGVLTEEIALHEALARTAPPDGAALQREARLAQAVASLQYLLHAFGEDGRTGATDHFDAGPSIVQPPAAKRPSTPSGAASPASGTRPTVSPG